MWPYVHDVPQPDTHTIVIHTRNCVIQVSFHYAIVGMIFEALTPTRRNGTRIPLQRGLKFSNHFFVCEILEMGHKVQPRAFPTKPRHNHPHWVNPPISPCPNLSAAQLPEVTSRT